LLYTLIKTINVAFEKRNIGLGREAWRRWCGDSNADERFSNRSAEAMDADSENRENSDSTFVWDHKSQLYFHVRFSFRTLFRTTFSPINTSIIVLFALNP